MKIPTKDETREILKSADPLFHQLPNHIQNLLVVVYRSGYIDACNAASKIAEEHEKQSKD